MADAIIYLHGTPGSPRELSLFGAPDNRFYAPDRFAIATRKTAELAIDALADDLSTRFDGQNLHLIGFSMGGFIAMQLAHRLGGRVSQIDLIASVAPFQGGGFMKQAAGAPLFRLAQLYPKLFKLAVAAQHFAARLAPARLASLLFASARGGDRELAQNREFMSAQAVILRDSFAHGRSGYALEMIAVTDDWRHIVPQIKPPIRMWHGTLDNWTPFAMAEYLRATLPYVTEFKVIEGASHYSTLRVALAEI